MFVFFKKRVHVSYKNKHCCVYIKLHRIGTYETKIWRSNNYFHVTKKMRNRCKKPCAETKYHKKSFICTTLNNFLLRVSSCKIAVQKKKKDKNRWPIVEKEPLLRTGLSVIERIRNFKTHFFFVLIRWKYVRYFFFTLIWCKIKELFLVSFAKK